MYGSTRARCLWFSVPGMNETDEERNDRRYNAKPRGILIYIDG